MNVYVIGGGASGLVSAITAAKKGCKVTILEKNPKCGKKLLITGNGHCNYWNENQTLDKYHTSNPKSFTPIYNLAKDKVLNFFKELGIIPKIKNGYYYPASNQAISILNALLNLAKYYQVKILYEQEVLSIKKNSKFLIKTLNNSYEADKVIIATGSIASIKDAKTTGYDLATSLGHTIIPPLPALVQLKSDDTICKELKGTRCDINLSLYEKNLSIKEETGELLFTEYGVSGICILNLSRYISLGLSENKNYTLKINFLPWLQEDIYSFLTKQSLKLPYYNISNILDGMLNYKISNALLQKCHIKPNVKLEELDKQKLSLLGEYLTNYPLNITGTKTYLDAQVCLGGIPLTEINPNTMESKLIKGLYFTGEILDVDGDCGGYNLGFAWMSGLIAGQNISKEGSK